MSDLDLNAMEVRAIIVEKNLAVSALGSLAHQVATDAIAAYAEVRRQMLWVSSSSSGRWGCRNKRGPTKRCDGRQNRRHLSDEVLVSH